MIYLFISILFIKLHSWDIKEEITIEQNDYVGDNTDMMSLNGDGETDPEDGDDIDVSELAGLGWLDPTLPELAFLFLFWSFL